MPANHQGFFWSDIRDRVEQVLKSSYFQMSGYRVLELRKDRKMILNSLFIYPDSFNYNSLNQYQT